MGTSPEEEVLGYPTPVDQKLNIQYRTVSVMVCLRVETARKVCNIKPWTAFAGEAIEIVIGLEQRRKPQETNFRLPPLCK
jgi:hypothetical protein